MLRQLFGAFLVILTIVTPGSAFAEDVDKLNEEGITAFQEERYEEAALKFRRAWELKNDPTLRKNEAIAWFKAGKCEPAMQAAAAFVSYGDSTPDSIKEAETVIANCKVELARSAMDAQDFDLAQRLLDETDRLAKDEYAREQANLARLELARRRQQAIAMQEAEPADSTLARADSRFDPTISWIVTGTGAAILVSALAYHFHMLATVAPEYDDVADAGNDRTRYNELGSQLDTARWLVPTLYVVGAATTGVGVYMLVDPWADSVAAGASPPAPRVQVMIQGRF